MSADPQFTRVRFLCFDKRQHPMFQVQMHVRRRVPLLKIVSLRTMLSELRVAKAQLIFAHVVHFMAPLTFRRSAANDEAHPIDTIMQRNVNVNPTKGSHY